MNNKIIIINGPNLNLLGEREQSQYGSISFEKVKENCIIKSKELDINLEFKQSNVEGELVDLIIQIFSNSLKVIEPYCDCSLSPNRLRFGPLSIIILLVIQYYIR